MITHIVQFKDRPWDSSPRLDCFVIVNANRKRTHLGKQSFTGEDWLNGPKHYLNTFRLELIY